MTSPNNNADDAVSLCSEDSFFADGMGYDKIGPATDLNREILSAAHDGQLARLQDLVQRGADINHNTWDVLNLYTPLCLAIEFGHADMVEWLVAQPGIDLQKPCCAGTPLNLASGKDKKNSKQIIELLLANGARDDTAIVQAQDMKTIKRLLQHGADINTTDKKGNTLLHSLCSSYRDDDKYVAFIKAVLELGANADAKNKDGETPLHKSYMHVNICRVLLEQGRADLEAKDNRGETVFYKCFRSTVTQLLIEKGANVNATDESGGTRIHRLCSQSEPSPGSHGRNLTLLVGAGINVNARGYQGRTALTVAIEHSNTEVVTRLLEAGADPCLTDDRGWNALHVASKDGRSQFLDVLLDAGVPVHEATKTGWTALHLAVSSISNSDRVEVVQKLLERGADPNAKNPDTGATPLAGAMSMFGNLKQVKLLVEHGADVNVATKLKKTLYPDSGREEEGWEGSDDEDEDSDTYDEEEEVWEEESSDDDDEDSDAYGDHDNEAVDDMEEEDKVEVDRESKKDEEVQETPLADCKKDGDEPPKKSKKMKEVQLLEEPPLHWAIFGKYEDVALHFLENGADASTRNSRGETPLLLASKLGLRRVVARLLEMGVEVEVDQQGDKATPLSEACKAGHLDVINQLTPYQFT